MSLYSDLNEVLTPYANKIKELATSDDQIKADLADVDNRTVKSAEQLISDKRTVDKVPYKYRASQSGKSDRAYDMIVGGTVCFNQLVNDYYSGSVNGLTFVPDADNKSISISGTITTAFNYDTIHITRYSPVKIKRDGRKYIIICNQASPYPIRIPGFANCVNAGSYGGVFSNYVSVEQEFTNALAFYALEGATFAVSGFTVQMFDLTAMFGATIADHIYNLEQATAGAGVSLFRAMFQNEYYPYNAGELISVEGLSAHVMRDADDNIVGSYPLDSTLTLRGVPVLKNGKVEFDGDTYKADGTVTKRYAERAYQSGDESLVDAITDGANTVYKLSVPTTKIATPYTSPQVVSPYGTEEYISETVCPVGHVTEYPDNLRAKLDGLPWDLDNNVNDLKSVIANVTGYEAISFTNGKYIKTNLNVGDLVDLTPVTGYNTNNYAIVDVQEGDKFTINATGENAGRLWCFVDSNNALLSVAAPNITVSGLVLTTPKYASKLIMNPTKGYGNIFKGENLNKAIDDLGRIQANLGDLGDLDTTDKSSIVAAINEVAQSGGGGGGSSTLAGLTDTNLSNNTDGQVLTYDGTSSKWVNRTPSGGSTITVDTAISSTSKNPVQNKVIKQALDNKAGTAVATTSANGLMSSTDKSHLDAVYADYTAMLALI